MSISPRKRNLGRSGHQVSRKHGPVGSPDFCLQIHPPPDWPTALGKSPLEHKCARRGKLRVGLDQYL